MCYGYGDSLARYFPCLANPVAKQVAWQDTLAIDFSVIETKLITHYQVNAYIELPPP